MDDIFDTISEFIYLRTCTAENSDRYFYYIRKNILGVIAERLHVPEEVLLLMSVEEVLKAEHTFKLSPLLIPSKREKTLKLWLQKTALLIL